MKPTVRTFKRWVNKKVLRRKKTDFEDLLFWRAEVYLDNCVPVLITIEQISEKEKQ